MKLIFYGYFYRLCFIIFHFMSCRCVMTVINIHLKKKHFLHKSKEESVWGPPHNEDTTSPEFLRVHIIKTQSDFRLYEMSLCSSPVTCEYMFHCEALNRTCFHTDYSSRGAVIFLYWALKLLEGKGCISLMLGDQCQAWLTLGHLKRILCTCICSIDVLWAEGAALFSFSHTAYTLLLSSLWKLDKCCWKTALRVGWEKKAFMYVEQKSLWPFPTKKPVSATPRTWQEAIILFHYWSKSNILSVRMKGSSQSDELHI